MRRLWSSFWLISLIGFLLIFPAMALAHPLDEFYQVTYIKMAPNRISMTIELYSGVLIGPTIEGLIDTNQDQTFSETERRAYVERFIGDVTFEVDHEPVPLIATELEFPDPLDVRAGVGLIRFKLITDLPADHRGAHEFFYQNHHQPDIGVYVVNVLGGDPRWMQLTHKDRDVFQTSLRVKYTIKADAPIDYGPDETLTELELPGGVSAGQARLTDFLRQTEITPLLLMAVLGLSVVLGALHALTPGHGKTLVAAYLIGSRGTVKDAIALGGIVTFTHTASVIVIGLLALLASHFIVPNVLAPVLEILSGLLVVTLGLRLLWSRWSAYRNGSEAHTHHPGEAPTHEHPHPHDHAHGPGHHHHGPEQVKLSDLLTLGISGGLVPCPEALGIMLIAIGLNRIALGLGLVVAFSFGLAAILIIIGVLLVRSKSLLDRMGRVGTRWQSVLPVVSAVIVTLLGLGIMARGLIPYL
jgi:ABC-type nickel/cobalt efflux system permease component RcnA